MLVFKSYGASLATFMEACKIASGIIFIDGSGGGSDEMKHLKFSWQVFETSSR